MTKNMKHGKKHIENDKNNIEDDKKHKTNDKNHKANDKNHKENDMRINIFKNDIANTRKPFVCLCLQARRTFSRQTLLACRCSKTKSTKIL